jgi:tRNA 2-thiouridine synthesizing protein E
MIVMPPVYKAPALDRDGYLKKTSDWNPEVAAFLAASEGVVLGEAHWELITLLREFYQRHRLSPPMRPLLSLVRKELGAEKGRSIYLMKLFGGSPAKTASKIAGLPRPKNCI